MNKNKTKRLFASITATALALNISASAVSVSNFTDIKSGDWYYSAVNYAVENNLFNGTTITQFSPNQSMTRGMFVTVLGRFAKVDTTKYTGSDFTDVNANAYYAPYVKWAKANKIIDGTSATMFSPDGTITREQMAKILHGYAASIGIDTTATLKSNKFYDYDDYPQVSGYAGRGMVWCVQENIMSGYNNQLNPQNTATRAEVATILMNAKDKFINDKNDTGEEENNNNGAGAGNETGNTGSETGNEENNNGSGEGTTTPEEETTYEMPTGKSAVDEQGGYYDYDLAKEIMIQINELREDNDLQPLTFHPQIQEWAEIRAKEQVTLFSHTRPNGTNFDTVGIKINLENLQRIMQSDYAKGYADIDEQTQTTITSWYNSDGHRTNMMASSAKIGAVSCYITEDTLYIAHLFSNTHMNLFEILI